jgi:glc operon protein GlcG
MAEFIVQKPRLTYAGARLIIDAAIEASDAIRVPMSVAVVDDAGHMIAFARMDGAKFHSFHTALAKARTAASYGKPSWDIDETVGVRLALASEGTITALKAGIPLKVNGVTVGGLGVASGTADEDVEVARRAHHVFLNRVAGSS